VSVNDFTAPDVLGIWPGDRGQYWTEHRAVIGELRATGRGEVMIQIGRTRWDGHECDHCKALKDPWNKPEQCRAWEQTGWAILTAEQAQVLIGGLSSVLSEALENDRAKARK